MKSIDRRVNMKKKILIAIIIVLGFCIVFGMGSFIEGLRAGLGR